MSEPNPKWRKAEDGEICGGGFDNGLAFTLIYSEKDDDLVRVYADGRRVLEGLKQPPNDNRPLWRPAS